MKIKLTLIVVLILSMSSSCINSQDKQLQINLPEELKSLFKDHKLAFTSDIGNRKGLLDIHIYDFNTQKDRKVTNTRSRDFHSPSWNAKGDYIAYTSYNGGWRVSLFNLKKNKSKRLTSTPFYEYYPSWDKNNNVYYIKIEPNGGAYFSGSREIYKNSLSGKSPQKLTNNNAKGSYFFAPSVSPNGKEIVYALVDSGNSINIYKQHLVTGKISKLTNAPYNGAPRWSPDGKYIAYYAASDGYINVYTMNADGSNQRQITTNKNTLVKMENLAGDLEQILLFNLSWSPKGKHIVYVSAKQNNYDLFLTDTDGKMDIQLTKSPGMEGNPAWSPTLK